MLRARPGGAADAGRGATSAENGQPVDEQLRRVENMVLTAPLEYDVLAHLVKRSHFIVSDSGGLQEEGLAFVKPVRADGPRCVSVKSGSCWII